MNITVTVFNDSLLEGTESFGLSLSVRSGAATLAQGMENVTLYIMDEDGKSIVTCMEVVLNYSVMLLSMEHVI